MSSNHSWRNVAVDMMRASITARMFVGGLVTIGFWMILYTIDE